MTERSKSKSRLFFIEILIIIVFFSICAGAVSYTHLTLPTTERV